MDDEGGRRESRRVSSNGEAVDGVIVSGRTGSMEELRTRVVDDASTDVHKVVRGDRIGFTTTLSVSPHYSARRRGILLQREVNVDFIASQDVEHRLGEVERAKGDRSRS